MDQSLEHGISTFQQRNEINAFVENYLLNVFSVFGNLSQCVTKHGNDYAGQLNEEWMSGGYIE